MSYIHLPDPHPGRCKNLRPSSDIGKFLRCLDYEGVPHECSFPEEVPPARQWGSAGSIYTNVPPKPWVKPGDNDSTSEVRP